MWTEDFKKGYFGFGRFFKNKKLIEMLNPETKRGFDIAKSLIYNGAGAPGSMYKLYGEIQPSMKELLVDLNDIWGSHFCHSLGRQLSCDDDQCPFCLKEQRAYREKS